MDRVPEGSRKQKEKMEETDCEVIWGALKTLSEEKKMEETDYEVICGALTTLSVKG